MKIKIAFLVKFGGQITAHGDVDKVDTRVAEICSENDFKIDDIKLFHYTMKNLSQITASNESYIQVSDGDDEAMKDVIKIQRVQLT